ncbi:flagellar basal body L-ring protein FlgH [Desulfurivibrio alkaliphilus]|uniref:Flagellar L-ring protein n=1 Tax=Desulfurivibrio alkaliphilus (strain DSM 19089 / UNIQEM U267 / AHT2) TaxID=589865 RepID=D6Z727_DESAT|nr:flagellar basal body L-ring protein FlgH [Desulfurivibrio alkaliphilus]ADH87014.1 flagellar L-ring protein [Desulfurivibrio alkaliphilus AHT 2]
MRNYILLIALLSLWLTGCATTGSSGSGGSDQAAAPPSERLPERFAMPDPGSPPETPAEGTIYNGNRGLDLYRDNRAREVGDILLVRVVETSSGRKNATTIAERDSSINAGISSFFGLDNFVGERSSINAGINTDFEGRGRTSRDSDVTATISARVVDKTMEGNLVIRGYQEVRVNNETQFIILSGLVRPDDINASNSVNSDRIADARIEYSGKGLLADKQRPGWLSRAVQAIWPF